MLNQKLRTLLAKPFGPLLKTKKQLQHIINKKKYRYLISVGDRSTYSLLGIGKKVDIGIFDKKVQRKPAPKNYIKKFYSTAFEIKKAKNPKSTITKDLIKKFQECLKFKKKFKDKSIFIEVDGEEDLAALVVLKFCSKKDLVFYGLPKKGMVNLSINKKNKNLANRIIKKIVS